MAMTDLELLQLAERASEAKRGERGPQGVSIRSIEQSGAESFTVNLTDGRSQEIRFPKPASGEAGPPGQNGQDSTVPGPVGARGLSGADGRDGTNGTNGVNGSFVDSAVVDSSGGLVLGLSTGELIRAGTVVGPAGLAGERGMTGLQGAPGLNGSSFLGGEKAPDDAEDGNDGDMWLDLSSPDFDVYGPKRGGAWGGRRFFMKQPPVQQNRPTNSFPVGASGGGGGGEGRSPIITNDLNPPSIYPGKGALQAGDLWLDDNGGLHIYKDSQWNKIRVYTDAVLSTEDAPTGSNREVGKTIIGIETPTGEKFETQNEFNSWAYETLVELEEEVDTLAPAVQRGKWTFTPSGTVAQKGQFTMYDGTFGNGSPTNVFQDVRSVWLNELDNDGTPHGFGNVRAGDLVEIFVEGSVEYGLYSVYGLPNDESDGPTPYWSLDVNFIRTLNDGASLETGAVCRFKIFNPPGGGEASQYVLKSGDRIEGELSWFGYKPEADGNPAENAYQGIKMFAREGGSKYLLYANTGAKYSPEELSTDVAPTKPKSITNKAYVDGVVSANTRVLQRTVDNLDFLSNTVSSGNFIRNNKTLSPPPTGAAYLLQDGGAEATSFASVQNLLINKTGIGPYADFSFTRIGDTISLQNANNVFFGLYFVKGIVDGGSYWDLDIDIQGSKVSGNTAVDGEQVAVRVTRFRPSVAQADPPLLSESGQLWYDTVNNRLNVWDQEDEEFHGVGGEGGGGGFTPGQKVAADSADDAVKGGFYLSGGNLYIKTL